MPIGTGIIYNVGDLILSQVSGSGTSFLETKIAAATSSIVYFDSTARINSASLSSLTVGTASYVSGSRSIITNLTASNISASGTGSFGMVGIGTTSPAAKLDVSANAVDIAIFRSSGGLANDKRLTITSGGEKVIFNVSDNSNTAIARAYEFQNAGTASMTLNSTGSLQVANTGRILGVLRLQITPQTTFYDNTFAVNSDGGGANGFIYTSGTGGTFPLNTYGELILQSCPRTGYNNGISLVTGTTSPSVKLRIAEDGNLGIGTTAPGAKLEISSSTAASLLNVKGAGGNGLLFVSGSGIVGIGTASPANSKLHIYADHINGHSVLKIQTITSIASGGVPSLGFFDSDGTRNTLLYAASDGTNLANEVNKPIIFSTNSSERMRIDSGGAVGIGTTVPAYKLDVSGDLRISGSGSTVGTFKSSASSCFISLIDSSNDNVFLGNDDGDFLIQTPTTSYSTKLIVKDDGNVGIGTTLPSSRLHVDKSSQTLGSSTPSGATIISNLAGGNAILELGVDTTNLSYIQSRNVTDQTYYKLLLNPSGGSVGIGTTSPTNRFEVVGSTFNRASFIATANVQTGIQIQRTGGVSNTDWEIYSPQSSGDLRIYNGSDYVTFQSGSGNVGIGTTSPSVKLHVDGFFISKTLWSDTAAHSYWGNYSTAYGRLTWDTGLAWINATAGNVLYLGADGANKHVTIATSGNVGIGTTSPDTNLEIYKSVSVAGESYQDILTVTAVDNDGGYFYTGLGAGIAFRSGKTSANVYGPSIMGSIYGANSGDESVANGYLSFHTRNSNTVAERMRIINDGNVGIGTTSPAAKLQVAGNISGSSFTSSISNAVGFLGTSSWAQNVVSASFATTAQTANALNTGNSYTISGLTVNGNISASGTISASKLRVVGTANVIELAQSSIGAATYYVMDNTVETGGRRYRFGYSGASADLGSFTIHNATDSITPFTILTSGSVGIGTTVPGALLEISSSTATSLLNVKGAGGNNLLFVSGSGGVGIGTSTFVYQSANRGFAEIYGSTDALLALKNSTANFYIQKSGNNLAIVNGGAGYVSINTNGSDRFYIVSDGNVGIGTTVPVAKLQVAGNISGSSFTSSISNAVGFLGTSSWAQNVVSASYALTSSFATTAQTANALNVANTYTIAGLTSAYVDVNGSGTIPTTGIYRPSTKTLGLSADGTLIFKISNVSAPATSSIETGNFVVQSGNFGLGTNSPNNKLDIFGGTGTTLNMSNVDDGNRGGKLTFISSSATGRQFYVGTNSSIYNLVFGIDSIEKARIDTNGNLGIGITSPTVRLHVSGSSIITNPNPSANSAVLLVQDEGTATTVKDGTTLRVVNNGSAANFSVFEASSAVSDFVILNNGNVGIGTISPAAKLEITGSSNSVLLNIKSPISGAILYVSGSGAVGIGTSNVGAYTLQVNGSFAATTKSFVIEHPTKAGKKLIYGSLESPYHGIRLTGRDTLKEGKCKIQLPDYMYKLILHDSVNIQLTVIKCNKTLYIDDINVPENYFTIAYDKAIFESYKDYDFFWDFTAIRADVPELQTEM